MFSFIPLRSWRCASANVVDKTISFFKTTLTTLSLGKRTQSDRLSLQARQELIPARGGHFIVFIPLRSWRSYLPLVERLLVRAQMLLDCYFNYRPGAKR